ncbi:hypothetical protein [Domibacillus indicus]|uniref:hypothetical protein n=1 Tax=Domibacillus indicus TaxID=1437523 RepID=UPI000A855E27|nr:hypothetical protein [Domibacillus indicus]
MKNRLANRLAAFEKGKEELVSNRAGGLFFMSVNVYNGGIDNEWGDADGCLA